MSKVIKVTDEVSFNDDDTANDIYYKLMRRKMNPKYCQENEHFRANIQFVKNANVYWIVFNDGGKYASLRKVFVEIKDDVWPVKILHLWKRHWWY